jgi:hypothetical protein
MSSDIFPGLLSLAVAAGLLFLGWPDRNGTSPRFLRFEAASVVYPPIVLVFLAIGAAYLIAAVLR